MFSRARVRRSTSWRARARLLRARFEKQGSNDNRARRMRRAAIAGGAAVVLLAAGGAWLSRENWNWARPLVKWVAERATGRTVEIEGDLRVDLGRRTTVEAHRVAFGNAEWGRAPRLATAERVAFRLRPFAFLRREPMLERLETEGARLALERQPDGVGNWVLRSRGRSTTPDLPAEIALRDLVVTLSDPRRPAGFRLELEELASSVQGEVRQVSGRGLYQGEDLAFTATLHGLPGRGQGRTPLVVRASSGATRIAAEGWIGDPAERERFSVNLRATGASLGDVWRLVGFPLPPSPPYELEGRFSWAGDEVRFDRFSGRLGSSDVAGDLGVVVRRGQRLQIDADLSSREIDLDDFEGFWGRRPKEERADAPAAPPGAPDSLFPDLRFDFAKLRVADAGIRFAAGKIRGKTVLDDVRLTARLERGRLELRPLALGMSAGDLTAHAVVDARGPRAEVDAELELRGVDLGELVERMGRQEDAGGELAGRMEVRSRGASLRELARAADGELGVVLQNGWISDPFLELLALHLGGFIRAKLDRHDPSPIHCLVGVFDAQDGVLDARTLLLDTEHVRIEGDGEIDLARERIDLELRQHAKRLTFGALKTPMQIEGPLAARRARLEPGPLVARGGAAVALAAAIHPVAALLALVDPGKDDRPGACREALAELRPIAAGVGSAPPPERRTLPRGGTGR